LGGMLLVGTGKLFEKQVCSEVTIGRLARRDIPTAQIIVGTWFFDREHLRTFITQRAKMAQESPRITSPDFMAPLSRISYAAQYPIYDVEVSNPHACKPWLDNSI
jgi:hypothetical protein